MRRPLALLVRASIAPAFAALALSTAALAAESPVLGRIVESGKLRVGMSGNQPPLNFKSKAGEMRGLEVDLATGLAELMHVELEIVQKPFGELLGALQKGDVDLVMSGMTITAERNLKAAFVGPYFLSGKSILTGSDTLARVDDAGDLNQGDLKLAALDGSTSQKFVETLLPKADLVTTKDYDEAVAKLLAGEVQALVADYEIVALTAMLNPKARLRGLKQPLTVEPIGVAVPPGDALLVNFLENAFAALEGSGLLPALRARWLQQDDWLGQLP